MSGLAELGIDREHAGGRGWRQARGRGRRRRAVFPSAARKPSAGLSDVVPVTRRLRFGDDLEPGFVDYHVERALPFARLALILALILYALFGILDYYIVRDVAEWIWVIRYAIFCPAALVVLRLTFTDRFKPIMQPVLCGIAVLAGPGIVAMIAIAVAGYTIERGYRTHFLQRRLIEAQRAELAVRNEQLDSALQESLSGLRRQAAELKASRARVVAAADSARRRIERNLHDGAQQHLTALAIKLSMVSDLGEDDPALAKELLEEARCEVNDSIRELRDLAHGIYPPLLAENGLPTALSTAGTRPTWRRPSTSAALRPFRTPASTPGSRPRSRCACGRTPGR